MALNLSALGAAIGIPLWIMLGSIYELYVFLGRRSYKHLKQESTQAAIGLALLVAGLSLMAAIGGLMYHLSPDIALAFGISAFLALIGYTLFISRLGAWWYSPSRVGNDEHADRD